jgi:uncharacterized protein involved in exopolysaccharide biosynthesis/Mrp family chromosome partitioning ATPase
MDIHPDQQAPVLARPSAKLPGSPAANASQTASLIDARDVLLIVRRNAAPIAACAVAGAIAAYAYAASLPKSYTAYSAVAVEGERLAIPELQGALRTDASPDPMPFVRTEQQALGAHQLLLRIVNELHLDRDPEFNPALRPPTIFGDIISTIKNLLPHNANSSAGSSRDSVVNAVSHALAITQDNRSLVIGVAFTSHDPGLAAATVNQLVADYISERVTRRSAADLGANAEITGRIDQVRGEIDHLEHQMQDLRTRSGVITLRAGSVSQQQLEDLATEASRAALQKSEIAANLARAQAAAASGSADELASVIDSQTISRLREQESEASGRAADLAARFGPNYPELRSADADLYAIRRQLSGEAHRIVASLTSQLNVAQAHEADVEAQLKAARQAGGQAQEVTAQLEQLQQDVATRRTLYANLLQSEQQTAAQPRADALPDVRVLSSADVPGLPSAPNMKLASGLGGIAGALLGTLTAFVRSAGGARFRGDAEIEAITGGTILASLRIPGGRSRWERLAEITKAAPHGSVASSLRAAQARLSNAARGGPTRIIAIAGVNGGLEAASVASAIARIAACGGQSVLLVDAYPVPGDLAHVLGAPPGALCHVLRGTSDWRDSVTRDTATSLDLLLADTSPGLPIDAFRVALENLLAEARDDYELIVLAGPPADDVRAPVLSRSADASILVVNTSRARPAATRDAAASLRMASRDLLHVVVLEAA